MNETAITPTPLAKKAGFPWKATGLVLLGVVLSVGITLWIVWVYLMRVDRGWSSSRPASSRQAAADGLLQGRQVGAVGQVVSREAGLQSVFTHV